MLHCKTRFLAAGALAAVGWASQSQAALPVIDTAAIGQLVTQIRMLEEQLLQAKLEFESITGPRGMERLLEGTLRNYLPANWRELAEAIREGGAAFGELADRIRGAIEANAVLTEEQLEMLSEAEREHLAAARRSIAMLQVMASDALATTSGRFDSLQELIDAIADAEDQKAVLDLQARIQAEQGMLQNESTKLQILFHTAQAEEQLQRQRAREAAIAAIGSLRRLPPMGL